MLKINDIYKNLRINIPKNILSGNSKIIVGFSGGPDSRLLIDFLCRSIQNPEKNIIATHVNYKLREKDSQKDEDLVTDICKKENIKLEKFIHPLKNETKGIQEKARIIRLNLFNELSIKYKTNKIFLGHNYNDHIETIFLNIIRGTGLKGLEGIKSNKKINFENNLLLIYRPLINLKKQFITETCIREKLEFRIDLSNKKNNYSRNKLRNEIIPQIEKINPKFLDSLNSLSKITKKRNNKKKVRFGKYKGLEIKEVIKILFSEYKYFKPDTFLSRNHYEMLENILLEETFSENLPGKIRIYRKDDELFFQDLSVKKNIKQINKKILIPGKTILREDCQIITRLINKPKNIKQINKKSIYINRKYCDENLFIRIRNNGDKINSITNIYTRVKKVLSNSKNIKDKKDVLILESNNEILWIVGIKQSISSYAEKNDEKVLEIKFLENPI
ncbi:MAG: tRNA lysidine(34) synthetase TilS [Chloroflexi bacterium]|nr:tRNA lysidine(34) synthetase TilS [Chloroflexota bacterium]